MFFSGIKKYLIFIVFFAAGLLAADFAQAGFGISPPYVKTAKPIFPGSHYEQQITLLRSSADEDMEAIVKVNADEISDWITIDKGEIFDLPRGELKTVMTVKVDVPNKAEIGNYLGYINIQVAPKGRNTGGGVAIALGARVDIDLTVTNEAFLDFVVRKFEIPDFEMFKKPWSWKIFSKLFYKVKVALTIKNTGNIKIAPTKVTLDVYDLTKTVLIESGVDNEVDKIEPFATGIAYAKFPTELGAGQYWGKVKVYKDEEVVFKDEAVFTVHPPGALGGTAMGILPWLMFAGLVAAVLAVLAVLVKIKVWRYVFLLIYILSWPLRYVFVKISQIWKRIKIAFWRKVGQKAQKYNQDGRRNK